MIAIDSVQLAFGAREILSGCYLDCKQGETVGLLGRNGSGKSSLLRIIFGSLKSRFCHLRIEDMIVDKGYRNSLVAYLPQEDFFPPFLKVGDILSSIAGQELFEHLAPNFRDNIRNQQIMELSGGEARVLACFWILSQPGRYVLLDEPFNGVSPNQIELIQAMINEKKKEKGIILTDHTYRPLLEISDRVVLLHNNSIYRIETEQDLIHYHYLPG